MELTRPSRNIPTTFQFKRLNPNTSTPNHTMNTASFPDDGGDEFNFPAFLRRMRQLVVLFPPLTEVVAMVFALRDPKTPWFAKTALGIVIAYFLCPLDLIPDVWLPAGLLDDLALIAGALRGLAGNYVTDHHRRQARQALGQP